MIPRSFTSEAFVLARRNFGEADRIIDLYTLDKGKISLIAKGVRKPGSRKRGHLEIFNKIRFQAVNGYKMGILAEAETIDNFDRIRKSMKKLSLAYYYMEVVGKITHEGDPHPEIYHFLSGSMEDLKYGSKLKEMRLNFIENLLKILGFWPKDKKLSFPDEKLEEVIERQIYSKRVGKILLE